MDIKHDCEFCNKIVSLSKFRIHLKNNHLDKFGDNLVNLTKYYFTKKCNINMELVNNIIDEYKTSSVLAIETKYNIQFRSLIEDLNLPHKTISDVCNSEYFISKKKQTLLNKYGVDNPSKSDIVKEKKKQTFIKNYGVDNIWKLKEYRVWWEDFVTKKYGKVCLADLYGKQNAWGWKEMTSEDKNIRINKMHVAYLSWYNNLNEDEKNDYNKRKSDGCVKYHVSKIELRIEDILLKNNISYIHQYWVKQRSYDFCLKPHNILIEVNGTYWHCDPRFYKSDDIIKRDGNSHMVTEIWEKDIYKTQLAYEYGYKLLSLWEHDINNSSDAEILLTIKNFIHENKSN